MKTRMLGLACCLVAAGAWLVFHKHADGPVPDPPAAPEVTIADADITGAQPQLYSMPEAKREQKQDQAFAHSESVGDVDVKSLLEAARAENRLAAFGAELASSGSREAVATLLKAIDLAEGDERLHLSQTLQALESAEASAELQQFMIEHATNTFVAAQARDALARVSSADDVTRLSRAIPSDPDHGLARSYLLGTLARVRNATTVPVLAELCTSQDAGIQTAAAIALGGIGSPEALASLVSLIERQPARDVNDPVVQAILAIRSKEAEVPLYEVYQNTTNPVLRHAATEALYEIRGHSQKHD